VIEHEDNNETDDERKIILEATRKAMDYLARRDHSELELKRKLQKKFSKAVAVRAILKCYESGWMSSEEELVERAVISLERKNKSYRKISDFLRRRGLQPPSYNSENEMEKAYRIIEKWANEAPSREDIFRLLHNRGFDKSTIRKVCYDIC